MDLFGDLPEPTNDPTGAVNSKQRYFPTKDGGGEKRKRNDTTVETEVEEEKIGEKKVCKGLAKLVGFVSARRGERDEMQDAHVLLPEITTSPPPYISRLAYFAVFDGHGGSRASQFAAETLHHTLVSKFPKGEVENLDKLLKKCLLETFRQTDEDFLKKASSQKPAWKDGSTATCLLVVDDVMYVANLGDSRAVLCRLETANDSGKQKCVTLALSKEHNPTIYEERMRIQRAGGSVRDGRVLGVLEVSRSIGDGQYKRCGVISTPDLRRCPISPNDKFVLLACDGLFKVFSADEAVQFVLKILETETVELKEGQSEGAGLYEAACQRLASEAVRRGSADNVTVILVSIEF
ncbi:hypothetical protein DNTS_025724 [Danionella cerebrum]|uniref:Integrin-linked kinase-associated serine/threonine phosphatase 2C n=1 Tax=Danionella cerebrum TaxID=2873325 RepID=A0A553RD83_9TELE|nr:hypothetical protein DNTS_025724 [Danionella translucida]